MTQASLYERLGSETGIRRFVTDILKLHHQNPVQANAELMAIGYGMKAEIVRG